MTYQSTLVRKSTASFGKMCIASLERQRGDDDQDNQRRTLRNASARPPPAFAGVTQNPQVSFAIATAVSAIRLEKPHSLSYQDSTRTKLPSITLVWSRAKIEDRSSWLKSLETLGWSV